jgi:hypothetical protein
VWSALLTKVVVTPRMCGILHSQVHRENNSNFANVFPGLDRLHWTLGVNIPRHEVVDTVPSYTLCDGNRFWNIVLIPFRKQRGLLA